MTNQRVLIICSVSYSLINFRKDFIEELMGAGFKVWCAAPDFHEDTRSEIINMGAQAVDFTLQRKGLNPKNDIDSIGELKKIIKDLAIDFVFAYTIKPVIYGSYAAQKMNVKTFSLITGLGFTFSGVSLKAKILGKVSSFLYKLALRKNNTAIFQNKDDQELFLSKGILSKKEKSYVVNGSGINLNRFQVKQVTDFNKGGAVNFILIGRLMVEKGIELYLEAAAETHKANRPANFHIVGGPPENMVAMEARLQKLHEDGVIVYHGVQKDVRPFLYKADVFVLPTYYREGVPRSILEALAIGMPIITTITPGCKETVLEGENGFLIPAKEFPPLLKAVNYFIENPEKIEAMGRASRKLAEEKFDVRLINSALLTIINQHLA